MTARALPFTILPGTPTSVARRIGLRAGAAGGLGRLLLSILRGILNRRHKHSGRETERALHTAEQRLGFLTDRRQEMVLAFDMSRNLIYANHGLQALTGYSVAELEKEQFIWWVDPRDRDHMMQLWETLFVGNSFEQVEYRMVTKDGTAKWASASWGPIHDASGRQIGVYGAERDITERKQMEAALRRSEERLSSVVESIPAWVWEVDCEGRITYTNSAIELITGRSRESVIGKFSWELMHEEDRRQILQELPELVRKKDGWKGRLLRYHGKDGGLRYLQTNATPMFDVCGELTGYRGVAHDLTDQREFEAQYRHIQKLECVGRLAGGVAHDFNNLLTVINGYSDMVLHDLDQQHPQRGRMQEIRRAGAQAASLTRQLLNFSRKAPSEQRPVNLNAIVTEARNMLALLLGDNITLTTRLNPSLGAVLADSGQMHQVLMNLVVNARDAMPRGGTVLVETDEVTLLQGDRNGPQAVAGLFVRLTVTDTGVGIDPAIRERLFEPFFTTKGGGRGTGLGLSTVQGIVRQSGGYIRVDAHTGIGSSFRVYLPKTAGSDPAPVEETADTTEPRGSETILVVEDQESVRELAMEALRSYGYSVLGAAGCKEAFQIAASHVGPIHLLVSDIGMPGESGFALAERIQRLRPEVRLLFMSGYGDDVLREWARRDADRTYLQKPFTVVALAGRVRKALDNA